MSDDPAKTDLKDLDERLKRARSEGESAKPADTETGGGEAASYSMAIRVGTELVSALIVGVAIGLLLDNWLDTGPWFLVLFFFLGAGAGVMNVYRVANDIGSGVGYQQDNKTDKR